MCTHAEMPTRARKRERKGKNREIEGALHGEVSSGERGRRDTEKLWEKGAVRSTNLHQGRYR